MHRQNRERFLEVLHRERAAAILPTGSPKVRNADSDYPFRPSSDFFYLTGFSEPEATLVLLPGHGTAGENGEDAPRSVLFLREKNPEEEVWTGRRLGVEAAPAALGVDAALPIDAFWDELPELLKGVERVVYRAGEDDRRDQHLIDVIGELRGQARRGAVAPRAWIDPSLWLHEQRLFKTDEELDALRRAAAISAEAHVAAMRAAAPGVGEAEVDGLLSYTFRRLGGSGPAYNNIVAGGANACILHYVENDQPLRDGDLLLIDAGCEWRCYASDVTRTFPVNGTFTPEQRALYGVVLGAQKAALELARPGASIVAMHEAAVEHLTAGLVELGLLEGPVAEAIESEAYRRFYMHKTGHWLGLDVHDCGEYFVSGAPRLLEPRMVFTVEPGLYVAPDDDTVEPRWRGIGIRIEDDVAVTADGHEVLTAAIPKEIDELEAACRATELLPVG